MNKIIKINNIEKLSKKLKSDKKKIVLCHGVFDLVHIGHLNYFRSSKENGDILIVSVTPEKYVTKGINRPYNKDIDRITFLSHIKMIDYVILNNKPTAVNIIKKLKPDIYSKGPDYKNLSKDLTGEIKNEIKAVKKNKGKIIFTNDRLYSSSKILNSYDSNLNLDQKKFLNKLKSKFNISDVQSAINNIKKLKATIIGEVIIDKYIFCETVGKSGKEPHLVLKELNEEKYLGGVGAIANNVSVFCDKSHLISYLGKKNNYYNYINKKLSNKVVKKFIYKKNSPTVEKKRFVDNINKSKIIGVYNLNEEDLVNSEIIKLNNLIKQTAKNSDLFIVSDYGHGLIGEKTSKILSNQSKFLSLNAQVNAFNIGYHSLSKYNNINLLIINETELRHELRDKSSSINILINKIIKKIKIDNLVITRGRNGAVYFNKDKNIQIVCPAFASEVVDKVGAGDAMLSLMSLLCKVKCDPTLSIFLGSLAAAQNVENLNNTNSINKTKLIQFANYMLK